MLRPVTEPTTPVEGLEVRLRRRFERIRAAFHRALYEVDESSMSPPLRALLSVVRLVFLTVDTFFRERLQMRAAALAFFTMLSIVPFAALVFAVSKQLGAYDFLIEASVRPFLDETFAVGAGEDVPDGVSVLRDTVNRILDLVSATDVRGLGLAGFAVLLVTIQRVVRGAEEAFDAIWGFPGRRALVRRIPGYILVTLVTPAALLAATTVTAAGHGRGMVYALLGGLPGPWLVTLVTKVVTPMLVCAGILLLYLVLPSARVRRRSALIGAFLGGLGWYLLQVGHVQFQLGVARANALYSGFGAFPIFLLWLHLSWVMVLLGAQVAATHQNTPTFRQLARARLEDHESREAVALRAMMAFSQAGDPIRLRTLARTLGVAVEALRDVLDALVEHALLVRGEGGPYDPIYRAGEDTDALRVAAVLDAVRREPVDAPWDTDDAAVAEVIEGLKSAAAASAHNRTIGELRRTELHGERAPQSRIEPRSKTS